MKFLLVVVAAATLVVGRVDCQGNIGVPPPPPPEDTVASRRDSDGGVIPVKESPVLLSDGVLGQDFPHPVQQQLNKISPKKLVFDDENAIEDRTYHPCQNYNENCVTWAEHGECFINPMYMLTECKPACDACVDCPCGCGPGKCVGWNTCHCPRSYQQIGYTCINPANFDHCINYNIYCDSWAANGDCGSTFMQTFCKKACHVTPACH